MPAVAAAFHKHGQTAGAGNLGRAVMGERAVSCLVVGPMSDEFPSL